MKQNGIVRGGPSDGERSMNECKHGAILYGAKCINCEREKKLQEREKKQRKEAIRRIQERAKQLDW